MFLDRVIGRRGMTIQLPPSILAKNIILKFMVIKGLIGSPQITITMTLINNTALLILQMAD